MPSKYISLVITEFREACVVNHPKIQMPLVVCVLGKPHFRRELVSGDQDDQTMIFLVKAKKIVTTVLLNLHRGVTAI